MIKLSLPKKSEPPKCLYCGSTAELRTSHQIYPHIKQDYGMFWACPGDCDAYVGTHSNSKRNPPLGRLANAELRMWKKRAHAAFDPLWRGDSERSMGLTRNEAYQWLTNQLGLLKQIHIGFCDVNECKKIVEICNAD